MEVSKVALRFEIEKIEPDHSGITIVWGNVFIVFRMENDRLRLISKYKNAQTFDAEALELPKKVEGKLYAIANAILSDRRNRALAKSRQGSLF